MSILSSCLNRFPRLLLALAALIGPAVVEPASAQVIRVEEDWVVEIGTPEPDGHAPQIITALSSTEELADVHSLFELNHATLPSYQAGGMELQVWSGDTNLSYTGSPKTGTLYVENEVIKYTMSMKLSGCNIQFDVLNGSSTTWGTFGGQGWIRVSVPTTQSSLWRYSPATSVANSRIAYAKHCVKKFYLKEVRYYSAVGLVSTDTTERVVHQLAESDD